MIPNTHGAYSEVEQVLRGTLADLIAKASPTPEAMFDLSFLGVRGTWQAEGIDRLEEKYGSRAYEVMELTRGFVATDDRMLGLFEYSGIGDHPDVLMALAAAALDQEGVRIEMDAWDILGGDSNAART